MTHESQTEIQGQMLEPPITIGVVEDNEDDFYAFSRVFAGGERLVHWPDGEGCLAELQHRGGAADFDVLVVDLNLPGIDGTSVIRTVRRMPGGTHAAVFVLTGSDDPSAAARALSAGADGCFTKPQTIAGLRGIAAQIADMLA